MFLRRYILTSVQPSRMLDTVCPELLCLQLTAPRGCSASFYSTLVDYRNRYEANSRPLFSVDTLERVLCWEITDAWSMSIQPPETCVAS